MKLPRGVEKQTQIKPPNAQWMTTKQREKFRFRNGDILLGQDENGWIGSNDDPERITDDRHLMTVAGSRAGKSSTVLKPNLFLWESSVLCIDPKGELATDTAVHRAEKLGQDVYILDPFNEVKGEAAQYRVNFNPLNELLNTEPDNIIDDAALVAESMIMSDGHQDHWVMGAKNITRGLILNALHIGKEHASLNHVRAMITMPMELSKKDKKGKEKDPKPSLDDTFNLMTKFPNAYDGVLASVGGTMLGKPKNERGSIISTAVEQTSFLDSNPMQTHLSSVAKKSLPSLRVLKQKPTTIYLVLPASRMATHFRWLRLIITLALSALEREPMQLEAPVLFVLEEFPQLGYMRQIEAAAGLMAGYHVKLHTVIQDLSQIKAHYKDSWETFIGNAGVVQVFGNTDATTLEYISGALGTLQIEETLQNRNTATRHASGDKDKENKQTTPLLAPFEIAQYCARETGKQIVMFAGKPPAYIDRLSHEQVRTLEIGGKELPIQISTNFKL